MAVDRITMFIWTLYIMSTVQCIQLTENIDQEPDEDFNTTTLYPVDRIPFTNASTGHTRGNVAEKSRSTDWTSWKINATFANTTSEEQTPVNTNNSGDVNDCRQPYRSTEGKDKTSLLVFPNESDNVDLAEEEVGPKKERANTTKYIEKERDKTARKEFKPSPQISSYYDTLDDSPLYIFTTSAPPRDAPTFLGSPRDEFKSYHKSQQKEYVAFPYKYETYAAVDSDSGRGGQGLQSKPTIEAPVRIPAGGLYKIPAIVREKPNSFDENNDYHTDTVDNIKENFLKKRSNPWQSLLHLVTALLPVGLIVSALTPALVTIEDSPGSQHFKRSSRRLGEMARFPAVSEDCKRRLLCEVHSDTHYQYSLALTIDPAYCNQQTPVLQEVTPNSGVRRRAKPCYKIQCEDPQAVTRLLHWLLTYHSAGDTRHRTYT